jgi:aryl-alcohol dehydrogenase-like predicted oxidoreductase
MPDQDAAPANATAQPSLPMRLLGRTGIKSAEIGFGAWAIGGGSNIAGRGMGYGDTADETSLAALQQAFELGINFVDTADVYGAGHSEKLVGQAMRQAPRRVHVATKVGYVRRDPEPLGQDFSPDYIKAACDRSLERLGVTTIDLYQLHSPPREVIASDAVWNTLRELKDKTKIEHYGISVVKPEDGLLAIEKGDVETIQVIYNLLQREAASELFEAAYKKSVGIIARVPLASGLLTGKYNPGHRFSDNDHRKDKYPPEKLAAELERVEKLRFLAEGSGRTMAQAAIQFCLAHQAVCVVIPGIKTPEQAVENAAAANTPDLTPEELKRVEAV